VPKIAVWLTKVNQKPDKKLPKMRVTWGVERIIK